MRSPSECGSKTTAQRCRKDRERPTEKAFEGPRRRPWLLAIRTLGLVVLALLMTTSAPHSAAANGVSPEASLVAAKAALAAGRPGAALDRVEEALADRPGWNVAERLRAVALLRAALWEDALDAYRALLGEAEATALEEGTREGLGDVPPDLVFGLAVSHDGTGDVPTAVRLYRTYADAVGASSGEAARAYARLSDLFRRSGVTWGDDAAELAKTEALDPDGSSAAWLPAAPDLSDVPGLAPYVATIRRAASAAPDSTVVRLPVLIRYRAPVVSAEQFETDSASMTLDLLIGSGGAVEDAAVLRGPENACALHVAAATAAMTWGFEPAATDSGPAAVRIEYDLTLSAPDSGSLQTPSTPDTNSARIPSAPDSISAETEEPAVAP